MLNNACVMFDLSNFGPFLSCDTPPIRDKRSVSFNVPGAWVR